MLGGHIPLMFEPGASVLPHVKAGKLKALGVSASERNTAPPQVATLDEQGLKGFQIYTWSGFLVPTGTPPATIDKLNAAIRRAAKQAAVQDNFCQAGWELVAGSPAEFGAFIESEGKKWGKAVRDANVQIN